VAELSWRDNSTGAETLFPWRIPDGVETEVSESLVKQLPAGKFVLFIDALSDGSLAMCLTGPHGARFARISPETNWALEERVDGHTPPEVAAEIDQTWRDSVALFAARNKELRESGEES